MWWGAYILCDTLLNSERLQHDNDTKIISTRQPYSRQHCSTLFIRGLQHPLATSFQTQKKSFGNAIPPPSSIWDSTNFMMLLVTNQQMNEWIWADHILHNLAMVRIWYKRSKYLFSQVLPPMGLTSASPPWIVLLSQALICSAATLKASCLRSRTGLKNVRLHFDRSSVNHGAAKPVSKS